MGPGSLELEPLCLHDSSEAPAHQVLLEGGHDAIGGVLTLEVDSEEGRQLARFCRGHDFPAILALTAMARSMSSCAGTAPAGSSRNASTIASKSGAASRSLASMVLALA